MDYDPEPDLRALGAMASNLTPYLYEHELYGMLAQNLPRLTVGGLLLRLYRLRGVEDSLSDEQQRRLHDAALNFEQQRSDWMVHYEAKIQQELNARLTNLGAFLEDYGTDTSTARENYPVEATRRTIIYHLRKEAEKLDVWTDEFAERLHQLDRRLQGALGGAGKTEFMLAKELEPLYPRTTFWWLYRYPSED